MILHAYIEVEDCPVRATPEVKLSVISVHDKPLDLRESFAYRYDAASWPLRKVGVSSKSWGK